MGWKNIILIPHGHCLNAGTQTKRRTQPKIAKPSPDEIRRILDTTTEAVTSLKAQLEENQLFDTIIIYLVEPKLDVKSIEAWEQSIKSNQEFAKLD